MGKVITKFIVKSVTQNEDGTYAVALRPVVGGSSENESFYRYTPYGQVEMGGLRPETAARFTVGTAYYLEFTPAGA